MPPGELPIVCPNCNRRTFLPIAAIKRNNYYCSGCFEKVPLDGVRTYSTDADNNAQPARPKKSSRTGRR